MAGWTDCDPKTNRPTGGTKITSANRVRSENTAGIRPGIPKASTRVPSTKYAETAPELADLETGDAVPEDSSTDLASEESETFVPELWQSENMPAFSASGALGAVDSVGWSSGGGGGGGSAAGGAGLGSFGAGGGGSAGQLSFQAAQMA